MRRRNKFQAVVIIVIFGVSAPASQGGNKKLHLFANIVSMRQTDSPTEFIIAPSQRLRQALIAAHAVALLAGLFSALPGFGKLLLVLAVCAHLVFAVRRAAVRRDTLRCLDASGWRVNEQAVLILPSTVLTPYAIWLHFKPEGARKQALLIVSDALPTAEFRRLTVKLKTSAS